jgi:hypothetical protein
MASFTHIAEHAADMMNRAKAISDKKQGIADAREALAEIGRFDLPNEENHHIALQTRISRLEEELKHLPKPENKAFDVEARISYDEAPPASPAMRYLLAQAEARAAEIAYHCAQESAQESPYYVETEEDRQGAADLYRECERTEARRLRASHALALHNAETTIRQAEELFFEAQTTFERAAEAWETHDRNHPTEIPNRRLLNQTRKIAEMALGKASERRSQAREKRMGVINAYDIQRLDDEGPS